MFRLDTFNIFIFICVLAPIIAAMLLGFISIFEKQIDDLKEEKRALELEKDLHSLSYNNLNQQIKPHFFFNTLNTILSLARLDRKKDLILALESLSQFMKVHFNEQQVVSPVKTELALVNHYFKIQNFRFRDRVLIDMDIDEEVVELLIPPFVIQTLIENAYKHEFEINPGKHKLEIAIKKLTNELFIFVKNSKQLERFESTVEKTGHGLQNISSRLEHLYGKEHYSLQIDDTENYYSIQIIIPDTYEVEV
ncbi:sensor histidine kinase [Lysinibacillus sp. SGAir0095]|uniref:sensor histidine kinase n=1 Tax=Lysinibacillus sp. SGAir0095 TaxID=2070463 RepID=UPI0010CD30AB|nr:histidine kinase [Lysinibacillus sp. SGAir0095]QCR33551.1 histidine kinase [Lysinibacillus sp. SGAir0095]